MSVSESQLANLTRVYYLYLDEFGHATFSPKLVYNRTRERFLTIAGFLVRGDLWWTNLCPQLDELKRKHFGNEGIALHYSEFAQGLGVFGQFNKQVRLDFWSDFLYMLVDLPCVLVSMTVDKEAMQRNYATWLHDPYHLLMAFHIERLLYFLSKKDTPTGDEFPRLRGKLIIESRGAMPDRRLSMWYRKIYHDGSKVFHTVSARDVQNRLESAELAIVSKQANKKGLEVADMICNPLHWNTMFELQPETVKKLDHVDTRTEAVQLFWDRLKQKIAADDRGEIAGYGIKIFPD